MTDTITTELRESMVDDARGLLYIGETAFADLCDAIDAVHQKAIHELNGFAEVSVLLPKDADGEVIHVGDVMDGYGKTIEVVELRYGRSGWVLISRDGNGYADTFAFTHHREPTVEDVLREFAEKVTDSQIPGVHPTYEEAIAEYAAKLRLAGES